MARFHPGDGGPGPRDPGRARRRRILLAATVALVLVGVAVARARSDSGPAVRAAAAPIDDAGGAADDLSIDRSSPTSEPVGTVVTDPGSVIAAGRPFTVETSRREIDADAVATTPDPIRLTLVAPVGGSGGGPLPLLVFAHGFDLSAARYAPLLERLASAGYVVAAPELPGASSELAAPLDPGAIVDQPAELSRVIDALLVPDAVDGITIDADRIAVVGHSDGGLTATALAYNVSYRDPRVRAAVVLTGGTIKFPGELFPADSPPGLAIHGTDDDVNPFTASIAVASGIPDGTDSFLVSVLGGDHLATFTTDPTALEVGAIVVDFLDLELLDLAGARSTLRRDADVDGRFSIEAR